VGAAAIGANILILAALVERFTGARAMAVQNYLAVKSQRSVLESEIEHEQCGIENMPDQERKEFQVIYRAKRFDDDEDLRRVVDKITSN
jgi:vacuolar iron transporter family protein